MRRYNPKDIEAKWQKVWEDKGIYRASEDPKKPKRYVLEYFPYPSGAAMHVGHVRNYTIGDVVSRFMRMQGHNVLHPMGWDGFGLPAENYAIKNKISPQRAIKQNTDKFRKQLMQMGFSYDWSREIDSTDPDYYKWTQWFFLLLFKKGLAYQQESLQWWCPVDKTVLANEQVENGKCWRCGNDVEKKALKQWFFKITEYADRLEKDLDDVNWSEGIKTMQRNWIGKSKGAEIEFAVEGSKEKIRVFTTRPDTLYGATFMVVAPEHPLLSEITTPGQKAAVQKYVKQSTAKSDIERQETEREKTGVFTGAYAVNPVNGEKIPVWTADYVLYGYGTGAIMAVPAHDERDWAFANKFGIEIREVIAERHVLTGKNAPREGAETVDRGIADLIIRNEKDEFLLIVEKDNVHFAGGGIEESDNDVVAAARREAIEETGYTDFKSIEPLGRCYSEGYRIPKGRNAICNCHFFVMSLGSGKQVKNESDEGLHELKWVSKEEVAKLITWEHHLAMWQRYLSQNYCYTGEGILVNSGSYNGLSSSEAREKIVADLDKKGVAEERINYKIRDWLISRQRYWGAPIPIIHCPKDGVVPVPEKDLPVKLPEIGSYEPSGDGRSPLARVPEFVNTTCPKCGSEAKRETDTMDGFACSSWYFLRFADPSNNKKPFDKEKAEFWLPVDDYIGGAEHAVMHLLYARFWTKVMYDEGMVSFQEPFTTLRNQGMILAPDGQKMSKSKGNTIEPDELLDQGYGADSIRIMELFIGPWNQSANWSVEGMGGAFRFLQRVWTICQEYLEMSDDKSDISAETELKRVMAATTKKVTEDLHDFGFNTAIAALMECVNELYKIKASHKVCSKEPWGEALTNLLQLLSPFAPHITEDLWHQFGNKQSIHLNDWPGWDEKLLVRDNMTIVVQVNGKVRANVEVQAGASEGDVTKAAQADENVNNHLGGKAAKKVIYVPGRLINFVV